MQLFPWMTQVDVEIRVWHTYGVLSATLIVTQCPAPEDRSDVCTYNRELSSRQTPAAFLEDFYRLATTVVAGLMEPFPDHPHELLNQALVDAAEDGMTL